MREKLLIIGPIGNQGGRAIEAHMIAQGLSEHFDVEVFLTMQRVKKTNFNQLNSYKITSLVNLVFEQSIMFRGLARLSYLSNRSSGDILDFVGNAIAKKYFSLDEFRKKLVLEKLSTVKAIFICADVTSAFLNEIITYGNNNKKSVFFRTTGSIKEINSEQKKFLSKAHLFVHHSESNARKLSSFFPHNYEIIDQAAHNESSLLELPIKKKKPVVFGYLGRLSPEKGIDTLLQAIKTLDQDCKFIIAGNGPLGNEVRAFAQKYESVEAVGWVEASLLNDFYEQIDCLIIPSLEESGPLVAIEALCASRLLITTRVGAMEERLISISKTFFFNVGDSEGLVKKIIEVKNLNKDEVTQISQEHRDLYEQTFSREHVLERYSDAVKKEMNYHSNKNASINL